MFFAIIRYWNNVLQTVKSGFMLYDNDFFRLLPVLFFRITGVWAIRNILLVG